MPEIRLAQASKTTKRISVRKRSIREWARDVWAAIIGRTFVTMRGFCPNCRASFYVECYHESLFPVVSDAYNYDTVEKLESPRFDMLHFNDAGFFPRLKRNLPNVIYEGYWYGTGVAWDRHKLKEQNRNTRVN